MNSLHSSSCPQKHAYLIMAHADLELLIVLIELLDDERNDIYLHIDKKWKDFEPSTLKTKASKLYILDQRIDVRWGHSSIIRAELLLFASAYNEAVYSYYHLLSGADLPIKTQDYIHAFFAQHQGKEFMTFWQSEAGQADAQFKAQHYAFFMEYERIQPDILQRVVGKLRFVAQDVARILLGKRQHPWTIIKGANWVSITNNVVRLLLDHAELLLHQFRYTRNGDEIYKHSIVYSSTLREHIYSWQDSDSAAMRLVNWDDTHVNSPAVYTISDLPKLLSSDMLFARKFSSQVDREVIEAIRTHCKC